MRDKMNVADDEAERNRKSGLNANQIKVKLLFWLSPPPPQPV